MTATDSRPTHHVVTDDEQDLPGTGLADFVGRHIGPRADEQQVMLTAVGHS